MSDAVQAFAIPPVEGVQFYRRATAPSVQFCDPPISDDVQLNGYGIDHNDNMLQGVAPPPFTAPELGASVPYSNAFLSGAANPIGRELDIDRVVEGVPGDELVIVSSRHNLRQLLECFVLRPAFQRDIAGFQVSRVGRVIYFGDPSEKPHRIDFGDTKEEYGKPFERLCTPGTDPALLAFYQYRRYRLLGAVTLVVRSEIDAVDEDGNYVEIKSTQSYLDPNKRDLHPTTERFLCRTWGQAFLGRAERVLIGYMKVPRAQKGDNPPATLQQYIRDRDRKPTTRLTSEVRRLAGISPDALTGFASLLVWVRTNVADGDRLLLSYAKADGVFALRRAPQQEA